MTAYRYTFAADVPLDEVELTLRLAVLATESLHGETRVRLDAGHTFNPDRRVCEIDADTRVGRDLNRLFAGFARREYGDAAVRVERLEHLVREPAA